MRCVVWAAVSSAEQVEGKESLPDQIASARAFIESNDWLEAHAPVVVDGQSRSQHVFLEDIARDIPAYRELMDLASGGHIDLVLVRSRDRLARSDSVLATLEAYLAHHGVQVHSLEMPTRVLPPDEFRQRKDRTAIWMRSIERARAVDELEELRQRHHFGMTRRIKDGKHAGKLPFGYRKGPDDVAIIHEDEAEAVQLIYEWFLQGMSLTKILKRSLTHKLTHTSSIRYVLTNPFYCGLTSWHRTKPDGKPKPRKDWLLAEGLHEPIIDKETWERAQKELEQRTTKLGRRVNYPLTGTVYCVHCGRAMKGTAISKTTRGIDYHYRYYLCGRPGCIRNSIRADLLEEMVAEWIRMLEAEPDELERELDKALGWANNSRERELEQLERMLVQKQSAMERWVQDYEMCLLERAEFYERRANLKADMALLEARLEQARQFREAPARARNILAELAEASSEEAALRWLDPDMAANVRAGLLGAGVRIEVRKGDKGKEIFISLDLAQ